MPLVDLPAKVKLSQTTVTVLPGLFAIVFAAVTPPQHADPKTLPILSGWINVQGSLGDNVKVAYMGVAGALKDAQTINTGNTYVVRNDGGLPALIPQDNGPVAAQNGPRNYTVDALPLFAFACVRPSVLHCC